MLEKKVTWLELFYDLLFVAAVSKATHVLLHVEHGSISPEHLGKFILIFIPIWWAWVGQTVYVNRYGEDRNTQRVAMIVQMFFVLIMIASLDVNFDANYLPFLIGYIGLRALTAIQYLVTARAHTHHKRETASFFGKYFWIGIVISCMSLFLDSGLRYVVLYAGIAIDILVPIIGRRKLVITPIQTAHLLERFALFTLILLGESVVSMISVLQEQHFTIQSIVYTALSFMLVIAVWWQYFENVERYVDKEKQTAGQTIMYGHLFIYLSLSMMAASLQLLFLGGLEYTFILCFVFASVLLYFWSVMFTFHSFKFSHRKPSYKLMLSLTSVIGVLFLSDLFLVASPQLILDELLAFFIVFAKLTA